MLCGAPALARARAAAALPPRRRAVQLGVRVGPGRLQRSGRARPPIGAQAPACPHGPMLETITAGNDEPRPRKDGAQHGGRCFALNTFWSIMSKSVYSAASAASATSADYTMLTCSSENRPKPRVSQKFSEIKGPVRNFKPFFTHDHCSVFFSES
jgi:hypothetical protein